MTLSAYRKFFMAAREVGEPPCVRFGCAMQKRCASDLLACSAWAFYVETGKAHNPRLIFPELLTEKQQPTMGDYVLPSAEIYQRAMASCAVDAAEPDESPDLSMRSIFDMVAKCQPQPQT